MPAGSRETGDEEVASRSKPLKSATLKEDDTSNHQSNQENTRGSQRTYRKASGERGDKIRDNAVTEAVESATLLKPGTCRSDEGVMESDTSQGEMVLRAMPYLPRHRAKLGRLPVREMQNTARKPIPSIGSVSYLLLRRELYIAKLDKRIDEDTAAWRENREIVQGLLRKAIEEAKSR